MGSVVCGWADGKCRGAIGNSVIFRPNTATDRSPFHYLPGHAQMVKLAGSHMGKSRQFKCQGHQVRKRVQVCVERGVEDWRFTTGALCLHVHSDVHCKTGMFWFHIPPFFMF